MRLGMFRLQSIISCAEQNLTNGGFYLFTNRPCTLLKAVWFDGTGTCLFCKLLEKGQFSWSKQAMPNLEQWMQIQPSALALLLDGIELKIPMDNNMAERVVRPVTVGRKNCLFIGAPEAGQHSAILCTMMEECKRCKVDGLAWLTATLNKLPNYRGDYRELQPTAMQQDSPQQTKERTI